MPDLSSAGEVAKSISNPIGTLFGWVSGFIPEGPLRTLFIVVVGLCIAAIPFVYKYYFGLLAHGAKPEGSIERQDYDRLRKSLIGGNLAARFYAKWLASFLDGVERFFGDVGMADRTLFPRAFRLKTPAPLWTAPAFDRCLLLALIYPIATIFLIWAISGHVGPAEAALGLTPDVPGLSRGLGVAAIGFSSFAFWHAVLTPGWKHLIWFALFLVSGGAGYVAFLSGGSGGAATAAPAGAGVVAVAFNRAGARAGARAVADALVVVLVLTVGFVAVDFALDAPLGIEAEVIVNGAVVAVLVIVFTIAFAVAAAGAFAAAGFGAGAGALAAAVIVGASVAVAAGLGLSFAVVVAVASALRGTWLNTAIKHRWQGVFQSLFLPGMVLACLGAADLLSPLQDFWRPGGPLLLFLGLLTLLNAPFAWASLGLTRALLRRGLELGGWWPYLLALVDACLAGVIIALLALTMVIGVQAFDELAVHGGGKDAAVLPLPALFDGIAKNPGAPEYWWAYALLLSTMIPSLINLAIGGMAFTRGIPGLGLLLLNWIPEGRDVPDYRRPLAAIGLTVQMFAGAFLGIAAQALLAWGLLFHLMPAAGLDLLWLCEQLADLDLPGKLFRLTGIIR
jgi:hypothetical protein